MKQTSPSSRGRSVEATTPRSTIRSSSTSSLPSPSRSTLNSKLTPKKETKLRQSVSMKEATKEPIRTVKTTKAVCNYSINEKVKCKTTSGNEYFGVIKYIGTLSVSPGTWIGIDIGCAEGKNDGSIQGKKYFECLPNYGIFVKEGAVTKLTENPKNIVKNVGDEGSVVDSEKESNLLLKRIETILLNQTNSTSAVSAAAEPVSGRQTPVQASVDDIIHNLFTNKIFEIKLNELLNPIITAATQNITSEMDKIKANNELLQSKLQTLTATLSEIQSTTSSFSNHLMSQEVNKEVNQEVNQNAEINRLKFALTAVQSLIQRAKEEIKNS